MSITVVILLVFIALLGGIGTTTVGPGGIFVTIAVFLLIGTSPGATAGTMSVVFIGAGIVGSIAYFRSGQLRARSTLQYALLLGIGSVLGALTGTWVNQWLDKELFGTVLGLFVVFTGLLVLIRQRRSVRRASNSFADSAREGGLSLSLDEADPKSGGALLLASIGVGVGLIGGSLGVGGPVLAVPLLVIFGVPMLTAVALAQIQSVFVATFATIGFAVQGVIRWDLVLLIGVPHLAGVLIGWLLARQTNARHLKRVLGVVLIGLGVYLAI